MFTVTKNGYTLAFQKATDVIVSFVALPTSKIESHNFNMSC